MSDHHLSTDPFGASPPLELRDGGREPRRIGILGGMGPLATADLYRKIILATPAARDQEHLPVVIDADPRIPDRTAALRGEGPSPLPALATSAWRLQLAGARVIAIVCNTAHAFLTALRAHVPLDYLDMIAETAARIAADHPAVRRAGLLATRGTIEAGLYHRALGQRGIETLTLDAAGQERLVDRAIGQIKAGGRDPDPGTALTEGARRLANAGAEVVLAACTEIPLALDAAAVPVPLIDPTQILAEAAVRAARAVPERAGVPVAVAGYAESKSG
jgi:aspartate racemase